MSRFQMQSWSSSEGTWSAMEEGAGGTTWRPRRTVISAVAKCLAWTGFLCIPAMQVVDRSTGDVVWRGLMEPFHYDGAWHFPYPESGPPIDLADPEDWRLAFREAKVRLEGAEPPPEPTQQEALFAGVDQRQDQPIDSTD